MITVGLCRCGFGGTLYDGLCTWCRDTRAPGGQDAPRVAAVAPAPAPALNDLLRALADELAGDVPDPLNEPLTLGLVWYDLCRLAGVAPPADVLAVADAPACRGLPAAEVRRWLPARAD